MALDESIIDFYLTHAPYAHSDKPDSVLSLDLKDRGWFKNEPLDRLAKWIYVNHMAGKGLGIRFTLATGVNRIVSEKWGDTFLEGKSGVHGGIFI